MQQPEYHCSQWIPAWSCCTIPSLCSGAFNTAMSISVLPLKTPTFFELLLLLENHHRGCRICKVHLYLWAGGLTWEGLSGVTDRTFVPGTLSSGRLTVIYNCLFIAVGVVTIFRDDSWPNKRQDLIMNKCSSWTLSSHISSSAFVQFFFLCKYVHLWLSNLNKLRFYFNFPLNVWILIDVR